MSRPCKQHLLTMSQQDPSDLLDKLTLSKADDSDDKKAAEAPAAPEKQPADAKDTLSKEPTDAKDNLPKEDAKDSKSDNLVDSTYDVLVELAQADPNNPLHSVKSFEELGLQPDVLKGVFGMRFQKPSKIQEQALPLLLHNPPQNMIGQSQSGTGKTAAFSLDMIERVDTALATTVQCICLSPTRELARQTLEVVQAMAKYTKVTTALAVPESPDMDKDTVNANIVVGTPGVIYSALSRRKIDGSKLKVLVLDEADNMLTANMMSQCTRIKNAVSKKAQLVLFSATFDDEIRKVADRFVPGANKITLKAEEVNVKAIRQVYMDCDSSEARYDVLKTLYEIMTVASSIVFVHSKQTANELYLKLRKEGHACSILHGDLTPSDRDKLIDEFREGKSKVLITTNVLARGIDIPEVTMVVNYDLPVDKDGRPDAATYVHRIGRTGRFGRQGIAISFVYDKKSHDTLESIIDSFEDSVDVSKIPTNDMMEVEEMLEKIKKGKPIN